MALVPIGLQIEYFADPTKAGPIASGQVYIGQPDQDPEILANRITVILRQENGTDVPIAPSEQPFTTGPGGIILYNGSPASLLADQAYSIKVNNQAGSQIYYVAESTGGGTVGLDDQASTAQIILRDAYTQILNDVGINTVPNVAWGANIGSLSMGYSGAIWANNSASDNAIQVGANHYNNGVTDKYLNTAVASQYVQKDGEHIINVAVSGPQDGDITWTLCLKVANDGGVSIGNVPSLGPGTINVENTIALNGSAIARVVGQETLWPTATPPAGWLIEDGTAISRTTYADLFAVIGTTYGAGDGSTTFNLPDPRGRAIRIVDGGAAVDPDATSRTDRGDGTTGNNVGTNQPDEVIAHTHTYNSNVSTYAAGASTGAIIDTARATSSFGGNETRMVNTYRHMIIQY